MNAQRRTPPPAPAPLAHPGARPGRDALASAVWSILRPALESAGCPAMRLTRVDCDGHLTLRLCARDRELADANFADRLHDVSTPTALQFHSQVIARTLLVRALASALHENPEAERKRGGE